MPRIELDEMFKKRVRQAWDKGSKAVLKHAQDEAWRLEVHGEDHDDQVCDAEELGILVGETRFLGYDAFFERYTKWVNRN